MVVARSFLHKDTCACCVAVCQVRLCVLLTHVCSHPRIRTHAACAATSGLLSLNVIIMLRSASTQSDAAASPPDNDHMTPNKINDDDDSLSPEQEEILRDWVEAVKEWLASADGVASRLDDSVQRQHDDLVSDCVEETTRDKTDSDVPCKGETIQPDDGGVVSDDSISLEDDDDVCA